jgi:hypothetical protein
MTKERIERLKAFVSSRRNSSLAAALITKDAQKAAHLYSADVAAEILKDIDTLVPDGAEPPSGLAICSDDRSVTMGSYRRLI